MKRSDLKELIKKSMLEVAPKKDSGAMTPEEEEMVDDYERKQAEMDLTSGPTVVPGAAPMREASIILDPEEVYNEYSPLFKQYREEGMDRLSAIEKAYSVLAQKHKTTPLIISQFLDSYWNDQYRNSTYANEDVLREADEIVAAWAQKQTINEEMNDGNEEMYGGYLELFEMNPAFEEGVANLLQAWDEWKEGPETEPEMVEEAKHDILAYLSRMMK